MLFEMLRGQNHNQNSGKFKTKEKRRQNKIVLLSPLFVCWKDVNRIVKISSLSWVPNNIVSLTLTTGTNFQIDVPTHPMKVVPVFVKKEKKKKISFEKVLVTCTRITVNGTCSQNKDSDRTLVKNTRAHRYNH